MDAFIAGGYLVMFLAICFEGPSITAAGGFAAKLGFLNVWTVFLVSVLGNLISDIFLYSIDSFEKIYKQVIFEKNKI